MGSKKVNEWYDFNQANNPEGKGEEQ